MCVSLTGSILNRRPPSTPRSSYEDDWRTAHGHIPSGHAYAEWHALGYDVYKTRSRDQHKGLTEIGPKPVVSCHAEDQIFSLFLTHLLGLWWDVGTYSRSVKGLTSL